MSIGRKIIKGQNMVIGGLLTELVVRFGFGELHGWRLLVMIVAVFVLIYRTLDDMTTGMLRRSKGDDKAGKEKSAGNPVRRTHWYENRFCGTGAQNRDTGKHVKKVQA